LTPAFERPNIAAPEPPFQEAAMSDPRDETQPTGEEEFSANPLEVEDLDEVDVELEDAEKVKGGRTEDPCMGGQIHNR
jgi:hypothetical protein